MPKLILRGMLKNHIAAKLAENLGFPPTASQILLMEKMTDYIVSEEDDIVLLIRGYAGTGKTTMINQLVKTLQSMNIMSVLLAPTGRAAKVLSGYTDRPAYTIHKKIYRQTSSTDGMGKFVLDKNLHRYTYFIVDEASMISNQAAESSMFGTGRLLDDLMEYVFTGNNCRLLLVGDTAQLPPVGISVSPALDRNVLERYGFGVQECELTDVIRQEKESGILLNATNLRHRINSEETTGFFPIKLESFDDVERISGEELIEKISDCYDRYGFFETAILTRSNKRANQYNNGIRGSILYRESEIAKGDLLMVVKNNYYWVNEDMGLDFIANGDTAEIVSITGYEQIYGFRFADVCLRLVDYGDLEIDCKIILDTLSIEAASLTQEDNQRLFQAISEDYADIKTKKERWKKIRENPYFNALQVKYAYAVTCHKAQGGQWKAVFIDQGYLTEEMIDKEYLRWMYTAFTRSTGKLFLVNFNKRFFGEE